MSITCPVCGYPEMSYPLDDEICPSCGFQFGWTDDDQGITQEQWRKQWIDGGMVWDKGRSSPPKNWDPRKQLLNIGIKV